MLIYLLFYLRLCGLMAICEKKVVIKVNLCNRSLNSSLTARRAEKASKQLINTGHEWLKYCPLTPTRLLNSRLTHPPPPTVTSEVAPLSLH
jgi:hypothetical protein